MQKESKQKFQINSFISGSRLVKLLNAASYSVNKEQNVDIKCGKWSIVVLTLQYHIKFPRYISNKLAEFSGKCDPQRLLVLVIIESEVESQRYPEVQMVCLQKEVKNIPCFSVEEARAALDDISHTDSS